MDYIKLNGKDHPFWYAVKAQREVAKVNLEDKDQVYFIWIGLKYGALKEKKDFKLTEDELLDIFEDNVEEYVQASELLDDQMGKLLVKRVGKMKT
jgi:hypothetical protein